MISRIKPWTNELGAAVGVLLWWFLSSYIPALDPLRDSFIAVVVILLGYATSSIVKKGLLGRAWTLALKIPDYAAEIITAVVGVLVNLAIQTIPDLAPYATAINQIVLAILFFVIEVVIGVAKGMNRT